MVLSLIVLELLSSCRTCLLTSCKPLEASGTLVDRQPVSRSLIDHRTGRPPL